MKASISKPGKPGFASYVMVLSTGAILTMLMIYCYRKAVATHEIQAQVQLRTDYGEKEDAILRSIVTIAPNRAIRAMFDQANSSSSRREPLRWQNIFSESLDLANARTSVQTDVLASLNLQNTVKANSGDSVLNSTNRVFHQILTDTSGYRSSYASAGINRSLGSGFPVPLETGNSTTIANDAVYPIIADDKLYGTSAQTFLNSPTLNGDETTAFGIPIDFYPASDKRRRFNRLKYPEINFGYAKPGDKFVAKRNWWGFTLDLANHDDDKTDATRTKREFVLSIYEIPSQLAISASSFMSLGQFASGEAWQNVTIDGGVFAGKAEVEGNTNSPIEALASRRSMTLFNDAVIGEADNPFVSNGNPFTPGVREAYQVTTGEFFPVSLASESGRVAFIPINRGADFFDRFAHSPEANTVSPTTWNNYSIGALQCAMRLDITKVVSSTNQTPTELRFEYKLPNGSSRSDTWPLVDKATQTKLPAGYSYLGPQTGYPTPLPSDQSFTFTEPTDLAYGYNGIGYSFILGFTGTIRFNNDTFGNPAPGSSKSGYSRPSSPFKKMDLPNGKHCIAVLPERIASFLETLGAANTSINNSLVVNVDYRNLGPTYPVRPSIPCTDLDYGLILQECADLTSFTRGFSLVTNLRTYFGDNFNYIETTPPPGFTPPSGQYYPPCSLFMPEKRYGVTEDRFVVDLRGQVGSLASETSATPVRPLDSKGMSGDAIPSDRIKVNLRPITHPCELPPITMMNWLVMLEERRKEFVNY